MEEEMSYTREEALERLLKSYESYFNIYRLTPQQEGVPIAARCEYFQHSEKYVVSRRAELWSSDCEEFVYFFNLPKLDEEHLAQCREYAYSDGMSRLNIKPGHMYSYITSIFIVDDCEPSARKKLKATRIYKSFHFSLHGWMDYHTAVVELNNSKITSNGTGRSTAKILKKILFR